ncbi:MAG: histidine phosphatase family protein [Vulcanimicrobiota bacterium]
MKIYVIRHGESEYNKTGRIQGHIDIPLSAKGKEEAESLKKRLLKNIDNFMNVAVYSSDLIRARQTAEPFVKEISRNCRVDLHLEPDLREINLGAWQGKTREELRAEKNHLDVSDFELWLEDPRKIVPENAESMTQFYDRTVGTFRKIARIEFGNNEHVVLFTHGGVVSMVLNFLEGRRPGNFVGFEIENARGVVINYDGVTFRKTGKL